MQTRTPERPKMPGYPQPLPQRNNEVPMAADPARARVEWCRAIVNEAREGAPVARYAVRSQAAARSRAGEQIVARPVVVEPVVAVASAPVVEERLPEPVAGPSGWRQLLRGAIAFMAQWVPRAPQISD